MQQSPWRKLIRPDVRSGVKAPFAPRPVTSGLPRCTDIVTVLRRVSKVPDSDIEHQTYWACYCLHQKQIRSFTDLPETSSVLLLHSKLSLHSSGCRLIGSRSKFAEHR